MDMMLRLAGDVSYSGGMGGLVVMVGGIIMAILAVAVFIPTGRAFLQEKRYVENKIFSSRTDAERDYWEKRKKKLILSLLPFHHYDRHGGSSHRHHDDKK